MKNEISSIELRQIVRELHPLLDSRMDKIIESDTGFYFNFYVRNRGNFILRAVPGKYAYLTRYRPAAKEPGSFCLSLRKNLLNAALRSIEQVGSERIIKLSFETKEKKLMLYIELFAKGNIVLCDEKGIILSVMEKQKWKDRLVAVNRKYEYPKKDFNVFRAKRDNIVGLKKSKAESIVKAIATDLGLGGVYAEEVCIIANIDKNLVPKKLSEQDLSAIYKALKELLDKKTEAKVLIKGDKVKNIVPFDLEYYESYEFEDFKTYNEALDRVLTKDLLESRETEFTKDYLKKAEKLKRIISQQEKTLEKANKLIENNQKKGELIYEKYAVIKEVLDELNKARDKYSWQEIKKKLKGHKVVKSINEKEKKVVVEV